MFAMMGLMASRTDWEASDPWRIAEKVLKARNAEPEPEEGIVKIKRTRKS